MKQEKYSASKSTFKFIANILSWTALALLLVIAAFLLYLAISAKLYAAKGEAYEPKFSLYTIISPSMEPNLRVYDIIVDQRVDSVNDIKIGDVITFISTSSISANKTITHRVIDIIVDKDGNYQYKTKGDNNLSPDLAYAEYNNIIGKVIFKIPQLGRIQFFLANQGGWLIAVVIPALIIIVKDVMKIFKLSKINKKAEVIVEGKKAEDEEEKKKRQEAELNRKKNLKDKFKLKFKNNHENTNSNVEEHSTSLEPLIKEEKEELVVFNNLSTLMSEIHQQIEEDANRNNSAVSNEKVENEVSEQVVENNFTDTVNYETNTNFEVIKKEEVPVAPAEMDLELPILKNEMPIMEEESPVSDDEVGELGKEKEEVYPEPPIVQEEVEKDEIEVESKNEAYQKEEISVQTKIEEDNDIYASIFNHFDNIVEEPQNVVKTKETTSKVKTNNKKHKTSKKHK